MDGSSLRIVGAIHQASKPGMNRRSRAHGARFNCSKQIAAAEPMITDVSSRFAQRHHLSVCGWIVIGQIAIPSPPHDAPAAYDYRSHGHFFGVQRALGAAQSFLHPQFVGGRFDCRLLVFSFQLLSSF